MVTAVFIPADTDLDVEVRRIQQVEEIQAAVGGWFEPIDVRPLGVTIYVNEEGRVRHMPFNARASFLWWHQAPDQDLLMLMGMPSSSASLIRLATIRTCRPTWSSASPRSSSSR